MLDTEEGFLYLLSSCVKPGRDVRFLFCGMEEKVAVGPRSTTLSESGGQFALLLTVGRPHITTIAALGAFTFGWLFTGRYLWFLTLLVAFDWYLVNLMNRAVDLEEDDLNAVAGTGFIRRNQRPLLFWSLFLLFSSLVIVHLVCPALTGLRVFSHLLGVTYNCPILPGRRRLKQLYFWKNTASALGFLVTLFGYPLAVSGWGTEGFPPEIGWGSVVFSAAFFFFFEVSYEVIYDLRDVRGDARAGIRSYPVVHGERTAVHIIDALIIASMVVLLLGYASSHLPWRILIMIIPPAIQLFLYKRMLSRGVRSRDCILLTWLGSALIVTYHLWVVAGLPGAAF